MSLSDADARMVAALVAAVRSGERVNLTRGAERVAVLLPQAEYDRLQAAAGDAWVPTRPFAAGWNGWLEGLPQLLSDPRRLTALRDEP